MEKQLEATIANLMNQSGVHGVVCADARGLCVTAQGDGYAHSSGAVRALAVGGEKLLGEPGLISVETDHTHLLISDAGSLTVGIYKHAES